MSSPDYSPTWKQYENDLYSEDSDKALKAAELFDAERKKETTFSRRARQFEESRKSEFSKNKAIFIKHQESEGKKKEKRVIDKLKDLGDTKRNIRPYRGYVLIKIIHQKENLTDSGIFIPDAEQEDNYAEVIAVGEPLVISQKVTVSAGVEPGQSVLIKKFSGADISSGQGKCKLIQFSDILAILE